MAMRRMFSVCLLAFFLLIPGLSVFSPGRDGELLNITEAVSFNMSVDASQLNLHMNALGVPGQSGTVTMALCAFGTSQVFLLTVPVAFDTTGTMHWSTDLVNFEQWPAFDCVAVLNTTGFDGGMVQSAPWGLRLRRYAAAAAAAAGVSLPSGGSLGVPLPGTSTPLFPVTWAAIEGQVLGGTGTECLAFVTAVPGIEGVLPVN
ncbi:MAG: hypothetical protein EXS14_06890 [Planctomycetes bacterium]|nr:hypothetical protein [Planctomycetota bacterium]